MLDRDGIRGASDERTVEILAGAERVFARYGFQRASMAEVASTVQISRAGLYKRYESKEILFRSVLEWLHESTLETSRSVAEQEGLNLEERLERLFAARVGFFLHRYGESIHGEDLIAESQRICSDLTQGASKRFRRILANVLRSAERADQIDLSTLGLSATAAADLLASSVNGLKAYPTRRTSAAKNFDRELPRLIGVFVRGLRPEV